MVTFMPDDEIGEYVLIQLFPRGQGGEAWKVIDKNRHIDRVLKLPNFDADSATREIQRKGIEMEITLLSMMKNHKFTPPVVEIINKGNHKHPFGQSYPYIVMEYVDTEKFRNLEDHLNDARQQGALPTLEMLELFDLVLSVLEKAHELGYVYNDVDIKHIFWDNDPQIIDSNKIGRRMRMIDWANAYRLDDPNKPVEVNIASDINQAGDFLHTMITYSLPLEDRVSGMSPSHPDYDVWLLAVEARNRQIPSINTFRSRIQTLSSIRKGQIDSHLNTIYDLNFQKALQAYRSIITADSLTDFLRRVDSILTTLKTLLISYHHFYKPILDTENRIYRETFAEILEFLIQSQNPAMVSKLRKYSGDLVSTELSANVRLQHLITYVEQTYELAHSSNIGMLHLRLTDTWKKLLDPSTNVENIIWEMLNAPEDEGTEFTTREWQTLCQQAALLERLFDKQPTTVDTELVSLSINQLDSFHNTLVKSAYPFSQTYEYVARNLGVPNSHTDDVARSLRKYEQLEAQPQTPTEDYRHYNILKHYCDNLTSLYNELGHLQQFRVGNQTQFIDWMSQLQAFPEDWKRYARDNAYNLGDFVARIRQGFMEIQTAVDDLNVQQVANVLKALIEQTKAWSNPLTEYLTTSLEKVKDAQKQYDPRVLWNLYTFDTNARMRWNTKERAFNDLLNSDIRNYSKQYLEQLAPPSTEISDIRAWPEILRPHIAAASVQKLVESNENISSLSDLIKLGDVSPLSQSANNWLKVYEWKQAAYQARTFADIEQLLENTSNNKHALVKFLKDLVAVKAEIQNVPNDLSFVKIVLSDIPSSEPLYEFAKKVSTKYDKIRQEIRYFQQPNLDSKMLQRTYEDIHKKLLTIIEDCNSISVQNELYLNWDKRLSAYHDLQGGAQEQLTTLKTLINDAKENKDPFLKQYIKRIEELENELQTAQRKRTTFFLVGFGLILGIVVIGFASITLINDNNNNQATAVAFEASQSALTQQKIDMIASEAALVSELTATGVQNQLATQNSANTEAAATNAQNMTATDFAATVTQAWGNQLATQTQQASNAAATLAAQPTNTPALSPFTARRSANTSEPVLLYYDPFLRLQADQITDSETILRLTGYRAIPTPRFTILTDKDETYWVDARLLDYNPDDRTKLPQPQVDIPLETDILKDTMILLQDPKNAGDYSTTTFSNLHNSACVRSDQMGVIYNKPNRWELGGDQVENHASQADEGLNQSAVGMPEQTPSDLSPNTVIKLNCKNTPPTAMYIPLNLLLIQNNPTFPKITFPIVDFTTGGGFTLTNSRQSFGINLLVNLPSSKEKAILWILFEYNPEVETNNPLVVNVYASTTSAEKVTDALNNLPTSANATLLKLIPAPSLISNGVFNIGMSFDYEHLSQTNPILIFINDEAFVLDPSSWPQAKILPSEFVAANVEQVNLVASSDADVYFDTIKVH